MSLRFFKDLWTTQFSKPLGERVLYQSIKKEPVSSILEIGLGDGTRCRKLIQFALQFIPNGELKYWGVDLFDARPASEPKLALKTLYTDLKQFDAKTKLIPGDPFSALARTANSLSGIDLVLLDSHVDATSLSKAWTYLPRTMHEQTRVFREDLDKDKKLQFVELTKDEIQKLAGKYSQHIQKAA